MFKCVKYFKFSSPEIKIVLASSSDLRNSSHLDFFISFCQLNIMNEFAVFCILVFVISSLSMLNLICVGVGAYALPELRNCNLRQYKFCIPILCSFYALSGKGISIGAGPKQGIWISSISMKASRTVLNCSSKWMLSSLRN